MSKEAMKLAASVLKGSQEYKRGHTTFVEAVKDIEAALAEQPAPVQRTWVGLTFGEICECESEYANVFARNIEAKLKEKNT